MSRGGAMQTNTYTIPGIDAAMRIAVSRLNVAVDHAVTAWTRSQIKEASAAVDEARQLLGAMDSLLEYRLALEAPCSA